jgi:hypothetical protein
LTESRDEQPINPADIGQPLCPNCLTPNDPHAHFCCQCSMPLTSHAEIDPISRIYAMGDSWRKANNRPTRLIIVLGMWLIFMPSIFVGIAFLYSVVIGEPLEDRSLIFIRLPLTLVWVALSGAILWKTTTNYLRAKPASSADDYDETN